MIDQYMGRGLDMHPFLSRVPNLRIPTPTILADIVQDAIAGMPLFEAPILHSETYLVQSEDQETSKNQAHIGLDF